jgi:acyl-CoA reductase-like NAD-dependent aldehyde dehydrogenase
VPFKTRAEHMRQAAQVLRRRKAEFARSMTLEMGKPIVQGEAEAEKCAWVCDYYADTAEGFLAVQPRETDAKKSFVRFDPLGVVLAVMPWNFPFWQVFRFAAPALMAGNAGVLKHASNVPRCALQIEEVFREAGFPRGLFATALIDSSAVGGLIDDPRIVAVTLTGSELAGSKVAGRAGKMLKKTVMELGGSDPFIVLEDADLDQAANIAAEARLINSGQSCICAKRFIVADAIAEKFIPKFVDQMRSRRVGDPLSRETQVGPQARVDLRDDLHRRRDPPRRRRVLPAHVTCRGRQGHAGLRRGDVRAGGGGNPRQGRGRRDPARERLAVRSRRVAVDPGSFAGGAARRRDRGGRGVRQRDGEVGPAAAVRRHQALGLRTRALRVRYPRVRQHQVGLDGLSGV